MIPGARLIILGRQGAGKGTQCVRLSRHYVVPHISTGDVLRAAVREGSELGKSAKEVMDAVHKGRSITAPLQASPVFPPMMAQMMAVGEDTGALDDMLSKIGDFYDQEVESTTEQLTSLIEPLMILFVGIMVGGMVITMYLPMFSIYNQIG